MNKQTFRDFDLPQGSHRNNLHYVPPLTRDEKVAALRRSWPRGTTVISLENKGFKVISNAFAIVDEPRDKRAIGRLLVNASFSAALYNLSTDRTMRSRAKLPVIADDNADWRQDMVGVQDNLEHDLNTGLVLANLSLDATIRESRSKVQKQRDFGHHLAKIATTAAVFNQGALPGGSAYDAQVWVRRQATIAFQGSLNLHEKIGTNPSLAQLADEDSDTLRMVRRDPTTYSNTVWLAIEQSIAETN